MPFSSNQLQYASNSPSVDSDRTHPSLNATERESPPDRLGRVVQPQSLKHPSLLSNIRRTWTATTDSTLNNAQGESQRTRKAKTATERSELIGSGAELEVEEDDRFINEDQREEAEVTDEPVPEMGDRVLWAKWDSLEQGQGESRRVLVIAYKSGAFAIWDCSNLDSWFELLSLRSLESALEPGTSKRFTRGIGATIDSVILPPSSTQSAEPTIAIVTRRPNSSSSHVLLYSLHSHRISSSFDVAGTTHRITANRRFLFISTTSPLAIHVFSLPSFRPAPFSPITDLVPSPFDGTPVFSVGTGGRLLAYATDRPIHSSRLDRSPAKPGAGLLAHSGLFDSEITPIAGTSDFFGRSQGGGGTMMSEAGQVGGEVARKVGEGVLSGVKAIGGVGMNYWMTRSTNSRNQESSNSSSAESKFSKSAPVNTVAGFGRRLSVPSALSASSSRPSSAGSMSTDSAHSTIAGTVIVVDLLPSSPRQSRSNRPASSSSLKTIAHFRPYSHSLALLSFSPSSTSILTASTPAHSFDIFELHPSSPIGASALQAVPLSSDSNSGKVWHRYRLQRGYSSARATSASWSNDGRCVAVGTGKGTSHVYAILPMGGRPILEHHFDPKVSNLDELPSLSVTLSTIARVRPSSTSTIEDSSQLSSAFPSFTFVAKPDSFASSFRPDRSSTSGFSSRSYSAKIAPIQDLLVFHPSHSSAHLHRLSVTDSLPSPSSAVAAASRGEVGKLATTAVSGLSQLMKSRGGFGGNGSTGGNGNGVTGDVKREWIVSCSAKAEWNLTRDDAEDDVVERIGTLSDKIAGNSKKFGGLRYSAFAEIETFSRSPRVLPRSIYHSQQFAFFSLPSDHLKSASLGDYSLRGSRRLEMRSQVLVRQGESTISNDFSTSSSSPIPVEPASFDQPIKTAMQTVLDQEAILSPGSPKFPAPSFPVGIPGKQGSWRDSIPIRSVAPAAIEGLGRVRQGLGRVKLPKAGEIVGAARRRSSAAASYINSNQAAYSSSISFEDDDAVFADRLAVEEMGSASTACTSEGDEGRMSKEEEEDEGRDAVDEWGWDEATEDLAQALKSSPLLTDDTLSQPPFDDDFDNFELELSAPPPSTIKPFSPPSLDADLVTSVPSISTRATPVNVAPMRDESPDSSPSARPINPLLEIHKPATISLSSSPASVSSNSSSNGGGGGGGGGGKKKKRK